MKHMLVSTSMSNSRLKSLRESESTSPLTHHKLFVTQQFRLKHCMNRRVTNNTRNIIVSNGGSKIKPVWCANISEQRPCVEWCSVAWCGFKTVSLNMHLFFGTNRYELITQDKMQAWQSECGLISGFCGLQQDSVDHLFFHCNCSLVGFEHFRTHTHAHTNNFFQFNFNSWDELVSRAALVQTGKIFATTNNQLKLGASDIFSAQERKWRIFQNMRSPSQLIGNYRRNYKVEADERFRDKRRVRFSLQVWNILMSCHRSN